ncbi:hypothetical protein P9A47_gp75 [Xanthomonas phage Elanor]|uniref:Uncharacterized protein n=1 Tax=Xanthomonas phage Elanor TaxID=2939127 RepID=A0A9E7E1K2_9CAUD|nr:hypothetical protein P9A47_gp75 [Xanthomonas phage Elanor]URA07043.1 hypothetical protein Elanor_BL40075 [Xanthomonas phage Elanor]
MASQGERAWQHIPILLMRSIPMSKDWQANLELVDQRNEDQRWREEAAEKLAVKPGQREALKRARQALANQPAPSILTRILRALRK